MPYYGSECVLLLLKGKKRRVRETFVKDADLALNRYVTIHDNHKKYTILKDTDENCPINSQSDLLSLSIQALPIDDHILEMWLMLS